MLDWLAAHPEVRNIRIAATDLNGQARGKRIPVANAAKMVKDGARFPFSALNLDVWGHDIADSPLLFDTGDADGVLRPTGRGPLPMPWIGPQAALLPIWMFHDDGRPFAGDARHALDRVLDRYRARGITPVMATELEFYLIDDSGESFRPPPSPVSGRHYQGADTLALRALDAFDDFFNDLYDACAAMDIAADTASSEAGPGQFEINLMHGPDPMKMADDTWLFKLLVKGLARRHGFAGSFMAKPYDDQPGTGLHLHFSLLDEDGRNLFDDGGPKGTDMLRHAVAGCMAAMPGSTLVFAPHANSYARMVPGAHAPTGVCWAYENRTASIRVPAGSHKARRIEHRVAAGDVNPYLMMAAVLGAALNGIEDAADPPAPITGNAYAQEMPQLPGDWAAAVEAFGTCPQVERIFDAHLIDNMQRTKRQEMREAAALDADALRDLYLETT